jgi:hypothetical protein
MIDSKLKDTVIDLDICAMAKKMGQSQQKVSLSILHAEKKASFVCKEIELRKKTERDQANIVETAQQSMQLLKLLKVQISREGARGSPKTANSFGATHIRPERFGDAIFEFDYF